MATLPLEGRSALITGGAVRIGRELALSLATNGADIALHYFSSEKEAKKTIEEIRALKRVCTAVRVDLQRPDSAQEMFAQISAKFKPVDILINSAAIFEPASLADTTLQLWEKASAINLRSPLFLCQEFTRQTESGDIINITDWRGERPDPGHLAYSLTKAAMVTLTRSLALSLAPGIRVNAIAPGAILPPPGRDADYLEQLRGEIPLRMVGAPEDIVRAVLYLLESPFVTGELLHVTGGQHL